MTIGNVFTLLLLTSQVIRLLIPLIGLLLLMGYPMWGSTRYQPFVA